MKRLNLYMTIIFLTSILLIACSEDCEYKSITTTEIPQGKVGTEYYYKLELENTCTPANRNIELIEGALPKGITLEASGEFMGTPMMAGTYDIKIKARVCFGVGTETYTDCSEKTKSFTFKVVE